NLKPPEEDGPRVSQGSSPNPSLFVHYVARAARSPVDHVSGGVMVANHCLVTPAPSPSNHEAAAPDTKSQ
ncbi:hypothetical protein BaRGS_00033752, partial [Batillaria attramentaria]